MVARPVTPARESLLKAGSGSFRNTGPGQRVFPSRREAPPSRGHIVQGATVGANGLPGGPGLRRRRSSDANCALRVQMGPGRLVTRRYVVDPGLQAARLLRKATKPSG